jgi:type VI protein secretion system component VasK
MEKGLCVSLADDATKLTYSGEICFEYKMLLLDLMKFLAANREKVNNSLLTIAENEDMVKEKFTIADELEISAAENGSQDDEIEEKQTTEKQTTEEKKSEEELEEDEDNIFFDSSNNKNNKK